MAGSAAGAVVDHVKGRIEESKDTAREEGRKAGEAAAAAKYDARVSKITERLRSYQDFEQKLVALYAIGLSVANADGNIYAAEREEINAFVGGCSARNLPAALRETITALTNAPPNLERALDFARNAGLAKSDIQDVIDIVAQADGYVSESETDFISRWQEISTRTEWV